MDTWAESDLAWKLVDAIGPLLADSDCAQVYTMIGSGDSYAAIVTLLHTSAHSRCLLPAPLVDGLAEWLDAYAHSRDAPRLREIVDAMDRRVD
ncbi:hypothetical protein [Mycobacterium sp. 1165178.9]|uniref:hypothetical protein n=1 Tax=Mycobacterium sp. 1165178.9 TaxID=1834070 RepID=UPI0007FEC8A1|nr:hypothetical protein [Mycobacterium sp. 1165178.9]OBK71428.1 hypothetical protein A5652_02030 [Mycobacterium sp. 1165178.9]